MTPPDDHQAICSAFARGEVCNREDQPRANNPYRPSDGRYDAWNAGWDEEEGPAFVVAA